MTSDSHNRRRAFPRAPAQEEWDVMTYEERARVVEELPGEVSWKELWGMSPGMFHSEALRMAEDLVKTHLRRQKRATLVAVELPVYYPRTRVFLPDVLVVLDVAPHLRQKWVVSAEGKGLDWVLEVHVEGDPRKDLVKNVKRYATLGIPEYFIYDRRCEQVRAFRLAAPGDREYTPIEPREGRCRSQGLGLELGVVDEQLCAWVDGQPLLPGEFLSSLAEAAERSARRAEQAEREVDRLKAELERLRRH